MHGPFRQGRTKRLTALTTLWLYLIASFGVVPAPGAFAAWFLPDIAAQALSPASSCCGGVCCCGGPATCRCAPAPVPEPPAAAAIEQPAPRSVITSPDCRDTTAWMLRTPPPSWHDRIAAFLPLANAPLDAHPEPPALTPMPAEPPTPPPRA